MDETQLQNIAETIGRTYGYEHTTAKYVEFADLKFRWIRSPRWMVLEVSDYLRDAPSEVVDGLIRNVIARTQGRSADDSSARRWLANGGVRDKVDLFLSRQRPASPEAMAHADAIMQILDPVLSTRPAHVIACEGEGGMSAYFDVLRIGTDDDTSDVLERMAEAGRIIRDGREQ